MRDDVSVDDCPNINFQKSELPSTMNIAVAKTVCVSQHVAVKAKVANLTKVKKENSGRFNMVHAVVVDLSRSIKLTLWESCVSSVVAGSIYLFHNLTVHKGKFTDEIYLNAAQSGTAVNITDDFQEIHVLSVAPQAPAEHSGLVINAHKLVAYKQALLMGYSKICFRIARGRARDESLQWSLYDLSIYVQILNVNR